MQPTTARSMMTTLATHKPINSPVIPYLGNLFVLIYVIVGAGIAFELTPIEIVGNESAEVYPVN